VPSNSTAVGVPAKIIKRKVEDNTISSQFDHNNLPDVSKQMFNYLLKRVAVLEYALKTYDGIDVSNEDKELEEVYANLIEAMKQE
jgi:serine O-acetyltransferase